MSVVLHDSIGLQVWASVGALFLSILAHEIGHYAVMYGRHKDSQIVFRRTGISTVPLVDGKTGYLTEVFGQEMARDVLLAGLFAGLVPIMLNFIFVEWWPLSLGLLMIYAAGSWYDIKLLRDLPYIYRAKKKTEVTSAETIHDEIKASE